MSEKKPTLFACSDCGMYGTNDDFVREFKDQCRKCVRVSQLEEKACYSEEKRFETVMKSMHALATCSQKTEGDQMETGSGSMDRDDVVLGKEGRSTEQLKEQKPVAENAFHQIAMSIPYVLKRKDELEEVIAGAKTEGQFFYIGIAGDSGSSPVDAVRNRESGKHHADKRALQSHQATLVRVDHTGFLKLENACALEAELIRENKNHPLCLNKKQGQEECTRAERAVVYVRFYEQ